MWAVTGGQSQGVDWLNAVYLGTAIVIAAGVIAGSVRKLVRRMIDEAIDQRIAPHLAQDAKEFDALRIEMAELRGERRRS